MSDEEKELQEEYLDELWREELENQKDIRESL